LEGWQKFVSILFFPAWLAFVQGKGKPWSEWHLLKRRLHDNPCG